VVSARAPRAGSEGALAAGVAAFVLATRLPFLSAGHGADPDAWRFVLAAQNIAAQHAYFVSRFPGFPIPELAYALLPARPLVTNGVTALFSALAAGAFAVLARRLGLRDAVLAGLALATTPLVWVSSTVTMDYLWSLAFALAGLVALAGGRAGVAGVAIGLAAGCRITALLFLVPACAFLIATRRTPREAARLVVGAALVALAAFLPVLARYAGAFARSGAAFFEAPLRRIGASETFEMATSGVWGVIGAWTLLAACAWLAVERLRGRSAADVAQQRNGGRRAALLLCASGALVFVLAYLRLPYEPGYLIPVVPFVILALGLLLSRRAFAACCSLLALSALVSVSAGGLERGMLLEDLRVRRLVVERAHAIVDAGDRLRAPALVVCRNWFPAVAVVLSERGCRGWTAVEDVERRQVRCGNATYVKSLEGGGEAVGEVLHLAPGPGRRLLGPGFPYPERR
jgi:hypothetical protein